ncbi:phage tail length tape measure family protein [Aureimonas ureilytica]|uniref:phage tail length tape measure family protein n=1 Tax=Aureimonas ureilytica TaxID=401562 RepID=UPI003CE82F95
MAGQIVTKVVFEAEERGVDKTAAALGRLEAAAGKAGVGSTSFGKQTAAAFAEVERARKQSEATLNKAMSKMTTPAVSRQIDQSSKAFAQLQRQADGVRKAIDPIYRDMTKFEEAQRKLNAAAEAGAISWQKHGQLVEAAREKYVAAHKAVAATNDNARLTAQQMQGLGYQINDVGTMLAMGASPFQVMASQAGQVIQVLGDGPQGMKGSLSAIGSSIASFARSIPVAGYAIAGVTTAVGALWYLTSGPKAREAEASVKSFEDAVNRLEQGWRGAGAAAEEHFARAQRAASGNQSAALLDTQAELKKLREDYKNAVRDLNTASGLPEQILRARSGGVSPAHQQIRELYTELRKGELTAAEFAAKMLAIRLDPSADRYARAFAESIRQGVGHATELEQRINAIADTASKLGGRGGRVTGAAEANPFDLRDRFGGVTGIAGRLDPAGMDNVRDQLRSQRGELEGYVLAAEQAQAALANFDLSPVQRQLAETTQEYDRRIAAYKQSTEDTIGLTALQQEKEAALALITKEATRSEEARRAGYALDLKAINDITAGQKAATAGQRAYNDAIAAGYDKSYANARAAEASTLSFAQAEREVTDALRQSREARDQAGLEGYAGQVAQINAQYQRQIELAQGSEAAVRALTEARDLDLQTLQANTQKSLFSEQEDHLRTLQAEAGMIGMNEDARRVAIAALQAEIELRRQGIDVNSEWGLSYVENARQLEIMETALDKQTEAYESARDAAKGFFLSIGNGKGLLENFANTFSSVGAKLSSDGFDKLFGALTGGPQKHVAANQNSGVRIAANAPTMSYVPTPTARPEDFGKAAAAVSGQVLSYAGRFNKAVDGRLMTVLQTAAQNFPYRVEAISGLRPGDSRFHGKGLAADVQIYDAGGKALNNYQNARDFRVYEQFAQQAKIAQEKLFPELGKLFRWGGYFSGGKGKYGALDSMHFDLGGAGMGGGSWESGLTTAQRSLWKGIQSIGMGSSSGDTRVVARGVSQGMQEFSRSGAIEGYDRGSFDAGTASNPGGGMTRGQAVMGGLFGLAGIAAQGYQSGNPLMGGLSGAMGGFELGGSLATAFPSIAGFAGPAGMAVGAAVGLISAPIGGGKSNSKAHRERAMEFDHDSDQRLRAA